MGLIFEWDEAKARENARKHRVEFEEAATAFGDSLSLTIDDPAHSEDDDRLVLLGSSYRRRLLVVVFTEREDRIRLISARRGAQLESAKNIERRIEEP